MGENRERDRAFLLDEIESELRSTCGMTGRESLSPQVAQALLKVPRHAFVPREVEWAAYRNMALPIGHRQTISQPFVVALMTDLLDPGADDVVLEVGTGSGYQAAVLSCLVKQVYSLEIVGELAVLAQERLQRLGFVNVEVREGDGCLGWAEHAPYDSIIVTAAAARIPKALIEQLRPGGAIVAPLGEPQATQDLVVLRKDENGRIRERFVLPVVFVPLRDA